MPTLVAVAKPAGDAVALAASAAPSFVQAAFVHGVAGHVHAALRAGRLTLPAEAGRMLEVGLAKQMVRGALLRAELPMIGDVIATACGQRAILIKGPAVADRFYADPQLRPFEDLDFLLPRALVAVATRALIEQTPYRLNPLPWPARLERHGHSLELSRSAGAHALGIELHWRVSDDAAAIGLDHARVATTAAQLGGASTLLVPDAPGHLLLLALHLMQHDERRLGWLFDLAAVSAAMNDEKWREAFALAQSLRLGWVLHAALDECELRIAFARQRPPGRDRPRAWGPLRVGRWLGGPVGYHVGQLAGLGWAERVQYLATGARGRALRAARGRRS